MLRTMKKSFVKNKEEKNLKKNALSKGENSLNAKKGEIEKEEIPSIIDLST